MDDKLGVPGFLLGRNFLRQHNVLVDLSAMKIVIREPNSTTTFSPVHQVSDDSIKLPVVIDQSICLEPFERAIVRTKLCVESPQDYVFRNILVSFVSHQRRSKCPYYLDESLAAVRYGGMMFLNIRNQTSASIG